VFAECAKARRFAFPLSRLHGFTVEDLTVVVRLDGHRGGYSLGRGAAVEEFKTYALNQALSLSLLRLGGEPLHANAIETDGGAIALFGQRSRKVGLQCVLSRARAPGC